MIRMLYAVGISLPLDRDLKLSFSASSSSVRPCYSAARVPCIGTFGRRRTARRPTCRSQPESRQPMQSLVAVVASSGLLPPPARRGRDRSVGPRRREGALGARRAGVEPRVRALVAGREPEPAWELLRPRASWRGLLWRPSFSCLLAAFLPSCFCAMPLSALLLARRGGFPFRLLGLALFRLLRLLRHDDVLPIASAHPDTHAGAAAPACLAMPPAPVRRSPSRSIRPDERRGSPCRPRSA